MPPTRRPDPPGATLLDVALPWSPSSVAEARAHVRAITSALELSPGTARSSVLAASELVSNAVTHGSPPLRLRLFSLPGGVRLEVDDAAPVPPRVLVAPAAAARGRGLSIVSAVAAMWGHYTTTSGKCVWCDVVTGGG